MAIRDLMRGAIRVGWGDPHRRVDRIRIAMFLGALPLVYHIGATHELRAEVPSFAVGTIEVEPQLRAALAEVGLVRAEDDGVLAIVRA